MNTERLLKLASFLRKLPPERFDFGKVVQHETPRCGTIGCAIGWTPAVFPDLVEWSKVHADGLKLNQDPSLHYYEEIAGDLFGMDYCDAMDLFTPMNQRQLGLKNLDWDATPYQVADLIEQYVEMKS